MEFVPSRAQGHLVVAAIRMLEHRQKRPPTAEEIADLLGLSREIILHIVRGLEARMIVRSVTNPFDVRIDLADYLKLEELPVDATGPDMGREIEDFHKKSEDRQKQIERMMQDADPDRKLREKASKMEEEFRRFRGKKPAGLPFRKDGGEESSG